MGNALLKSGMGRVNLRTSSEIFRMKGQYTFLKYLIMEVFPKQEITFLSAAMLIWIKFPGI
jgi:hypothetical protein